jgi:hypothetical protein
MSPVYPFEWLEQLTGFNNGFEIKGFLLLDGLPSRINELLLPKVLVLRRQDPVFACSSEQFHHGKVRSWTLVVRGYILQDSLAMVGNQSRRKRL